MKKIVLLSAISFFIASVSFSQKIITYDFKTKTITVDPEKVPPEKFVLEYNTTYGLKITNIDTRLYSDFSITPDQRNFFEPIVPASFKIPETAPIKDTIGTNLTAQIENKEQKITDGSSSTLKEIGVLGKKALGNGVMNIMNVIKPDKSNEKEITNNIKSNLTKEEQDRLAKLIKQYEAEQKMQKKIADCKTLIEKLTENVKSVTGSFQEIENIKRLNNQLVSILNDYSLSPEMITEELASHEQNYKKFLEQKDRVLPEFNKNYKTFKDDYAAFSKDTNVISVLNADLEMRMSVNALVNSVESMKGSVDELVKNDGYSNLTESIQNMIIQLKNGVFTDISFPDPIKPTKDQMFINIEYNELKKGKNAGGNAVACKKTLTFDVKGGVQIAFSTGLMVTTFLYDRKYSVYPSTQKDTSIIKKDKNHNLFQPTIGALMHILFRTNHSVTGGFTWGIGANVSAISNLTIFVGLSMVLGREERFILSGGLAAAPVDYLKGKYSLDTPVKTSDIDQTSIVEKAFRPGIFVGFTYNLTSQKKEESGISVKGK